MVDARSTPDDSPRLEGDTATIRLDDGRVVEVPVEYVQVAQEVAASSSNPIAAASDGVSPRPCQKMSAGRKRDRMSHLAQCTRALHGIQKISSIGTACARGRLKARQESHTGGLAEEDLYRDRRAGAFCLQSTWTSEPRGV